MMKTDHSSITLNHSVKPTNDVMNEFNRCVRELTFNRSEKICTKINRNLQILANVTHRTAFDPSSPVTSDFIINLLELFSVLEPHSPILWSCVNVLHTACKFQATHNALIQNHQFIPYLSLMLGDHLSQDKKVTLLNVLQDLTCGMHCDSFMTNLQHLITTLSRWSLNKECNKIVVLSLGIIVNVCVKNKPAQFLLTKTVNVRELTSNVLKLTDLKVDTCAAKLFIILDHIECVMREEIFAKFLGNTLRSITDAILNKDHLELRQHIVFYLNLDVRGSEVKKIIMVHTTTVPQMLLDMANALQTITPGSVDHTGAAEECVNLVFRFLCSFLEYIPNGADELYQQFTTSTLEWIHNDLVAVDALNCLKTVLQLLLQTSSNDMKQMMDLIHNEIIKIIPATNWLDVALSTTICKKYEHLFDLLKLFFQKAYTRDKILLFLTKDQFKDFFDVVINHPPDAEGHAIPDIFNNDVLDMYISALSLVSFIGSYCNTWEQYNNLLLRENRVQTLLALGLTSGSNKRRRNALEVLSGNKSALSKSVSDILVMMSSDNVPLPDADRIIFQKDGSSSRDASTIKIPFTYNPYSNLVKLDEVISKLSHAKSMQQLNVDVMDVIGLYEHRLSMCEHSEKMLTSHAEATSTFNTRLQQQIQEMKTALAGSQRMYHQMEYKRRDANKQIDRLEGQLRELRVEKELRIKLQNQLKELQEELENAQKCYAELVVLHEAAIGEKDQALQSNAVLKESLVKMEKVIKRQEDTNKALQADIHATKRNLEDKDMALKLTEEELDRTSEELQKLRQENEERRTILDQISRISNFLKPEQKNFP